MLRYSGSGAALIWAGLQGAPTCAAGLLSSAAASACCLLVVLVCLVDGSFDKHKQVPPVQKVLRKEMWVRLRHDCRAHAQAREEGLSGGWGRAACIMIPQAALRPPHA